MTNKAQISARDSYRRRIRRHITLCTIVVALAVALIAGLAHLDAMKELRPLVLGVLGGLLLLLLIGTAVNLRCPACRRFLDSRFLMSNAPACPRCQTTLRG